MELIVVGWCLRERAVMEMHIWWWGEVGVHRVLDLVRAAHQDRWCSNSRQQCRSKTTIKMDHTTIKFQCRCNKQSHRANKTSDLSIDTITKTTLAEADLTDNQCSRIALSHSLKAMDTLSMVPLHQCVEAIQILTMLISMSKMKSKQTPLARPFHNEVANAHLPSA